jgi:hypothetical protein
MLNAPVESMSRDLHEYGEDETANWILTCSDDELVRVCSVAEWLLYFGPSRPSGGSMMIARACALAAVYVREGTPRDLARARRKRIADPAPMPSPGRRPDNALQMKHSREYGVGDDFRAFWGAAHYREVQLRAPRP